MLKKFCCFFCVVAVLLSAICLPVLADTVEFDGGNVSFSVPSGYEYITVKNASRQKDIAEKFGYSSKSLATYMKNNSLMLIAVNEKEQSQFHLKSTSTDFTSGIVSLSNVQKSERAEIGNSIFGENGYSEKTVGGKIYFETEIEGVFTFSTVENGELFTATYYGSDENSAINLIKGISFKTKSASKPAIGSSIMPLIIATLMTLAATGLVVFILVSLINDWKNKGENDDEEEIKIKRRKF